MDRSRLEAFSDGVIAVAITLLALNIVVEGPHHGKLLDQLYDKRYAFVAYLISFLTIGIIWVNHHALIRTIKVVDRTLLFLNLLLLLFVVLIPFGTATAAQYLPFGGRDTQLAMMLYGGTFLGMSAGFGAIFEWTLHGQRVYHPLPSDQHWAARRRFVGGAVGYAIAIIVAGFNAIVSFAIIGLIAVYYIFERTPSSSPGAHPADEEQLTRK